jgi:hypothetical protein
MEETNVVKTNSLDTAKLNKVVEGLFSNGIKMTEQFDALSYNDEEMNYILRKMNERVRQEVGYM